MSCSKKEDNQPVTTTSDVVTNLEAVRADYLPSSMALSEGATFTSLNSRQEDPCEGENFFSCQGILVKLYLKSSQEMFELVISLLESVTPVIENFVDGQEGSFLGEEGETISIKKVNATQFSILAQSANNQSYLHFDVNQNNYILRVDFSAVPDKAPEDPESGIVQVLVDFTSTSQWEVTTSSYGQACQEEDPNTPEKIKLILSRNGDLWNGKAQTYHPRWLKFDKATCDTSITDDTAMLMYTEFIGNDAASTCQSVLSSVMEVTFSDHPNPFCTRSETNISWNNNCSSYETSVSEQSFNQANFSNPSDFYQETISLPTAL